MSTGSCAIHFCIPFALQDPGMQMEESLTELCKEQILSQGSGYWLLAWEVIPLIWGEIPGSRRRTEKRDKEGRKAKRALVKGVRGKQGSLLLERWGRMKPESFHQRGRNMGYFSINFLSIIYWCLGYICWGYFLYVPLPFFFFFLKLWDGEIQVQLTPEVAGDHCQPRAKWS